MVKVRTKLKRNAHFSGTLPVSTMALIAEVMHGCVALVSPGATPTSHVSIPQQYLVTLLQQTFATFEELNHVHPKQRSLPETRLKAIAWVCSIVLLNTPSAGAPPAPHFAMCRSGHTCTEADKVEFKTDMSSIFSDIGMYVLRVSFGLVLYCCLLGSNWSLGGVIFWIFRPPGPVGNKTVKKTKKKQKKHHFLAPILVPFS